VKPGDVLCGIETDKATVDYEMQENGFVAKLLFPAGTKDVQLGTIIAILVEKQSEIAAFANYDGASKSAAPVQTAPVQSAPAKATPVKAAYPDHVKLEMPNLSPTMEKVIIQRLKTIGKHKKMEQVSR
jgi:pyruvate dehydrogenase E2 component (dihydrolipoamide acetyltransferase)